MCFHFCIHLFCLLFIKGLQAANQETSIFVEDAERACLPCGHDVGTEPGWVVWFKIAQVNGSRPVPVIACSGETALFPSCEGDEETSAEDLKFICSRNHDLNIRNTHVSDSGIYICAAASYLDRCLCNSRTMCEWDMLKETQNKFNNHQYQKSVRLTVTALVETTYIITVHTGDVTYAGTGARVFIGLSGKKIWQSELSHSSCSCFERDKIDVFRAKTKNLGCITDLYVWHDNGGIGSGWYLDTIDVYDGHTNYKFELNAWIYGPEKTRLRLKAIDAPSCGCTVSSSEPYSNMDNCVNGMVNMKALCDQFSIQNGTVETFTSPSSMRPMDELLSSTLPSEHETPNVLVPATTGAVVSLAVLVVGVAGVFCHLKKRRVLKRNERTCRKVTPSENVCYVRGHVKPAAKYKEPSAELFSIYENM
uniref:Uncharacterized protein LOC116945042 isoform X2 n=1 Tax=Petromyzon marinus TaxID=7757 RepID=A0AAJ7TBS1_PETMA|nr:uncharacterized protein LOC116945042 isoform X2 [Petromyzon marinus]